MRAAAVEPPWWGRRGPPRAPVPALLVLLPLLALLALAAARELPKTSILHIAHVNGAPLAPPGGAAIQQ
jgi:hypothetical protein